MGLKQTRKFSLRNKIKKMNEEEIIKEAKGIMDNFMTALDKAEVKNKEFGSNRDVNLREPSESEYGQEFKEAFLKNAPNKNQDFIIAEKKSWSK